MSFIDLISNKGQRLLARVDAGIERVQEVIQEIKDREMIDMNDPTQRLARDSGDPDYWSTKQDDLRDPERHREMKERKDDD